MVFGNKTSGEVNEIRANSKGLPKAVGKSGIYKVIKALKYKYPGHIFDNQLDGLENMETTSKRAHAFVSRPYQGGLMRMNVIMTVQIVEILGEVLGGIATYEIHVFSKKGTKEDKKVGNLNRDIIQ